MKALMWCLVGLTLLSAACGEDDEGKKITEPGDPLAGRTVCELPAYFYVSSPEDLEVLKNQDCDAISPGNVVFRDELATLEGFEKIKYVRGTLEIRDSKLTDISALRGLEFVGAFVIKGNKALDNCQATALAANVPSQFDADISGNAGQEVCSMWPSQ
jgi:hypothetical protein